MAFNGVLSVTRDRTFPVSLKENAREKGENKSDVTREWLKIWSGIREKAASLRVIVKYFPARKTGKLKNIAGISGKGPPLRPPNM